MPRADVDIFFSTNKPAFAYIDGGEAVGEASAVAADEGAGQVGVNAGLTGASISGLASNLSAQEPGTEITVTSETFHSIGIEWNLPAGGDGDRNATVSVQYRKAGAGSWKNASNLVRTENYIWHFASFGRPYADVYLFNDVLDPDGAYYSTRINKFAGSIMFLTPGTTYDIRLEFNDPDDTPSSRLVEFQTTTRAIPVKPTGGRTLFVVPGSGGGDGSDLDPFRGLDAANAAAQPGDRFFLRNGVYGAATFTTSGAEDNWIVYEPDLASPGAVLYRSGIGADHIWFDGLTVTGDASTEDIDGSFFNVTAFYVPPAYSSSQPDDIIITNCTITRFVEGIKSFYPVSRWVCMDNDITGIWAVGSWNQQPPASSSGMGISLGGEGNDGGPGHVIAYNEIRQCTDGITMSGDSDCYGNLVLDNRGNSFSGDQDGGQPNPTNLRCWGNHLAQSGSFPLSFQVQQGGVQYYLYNQYSQAFLGLWKWKVQDRLVFMHNTFVGDNSEAQYMMRTICRGNLWITGNDGAAQIWGVANGFNNKPDSSSFPYFTPIWATDLDYDGFDVGGANPAFSWYYPNTPERTDYSSFTAFASGVGIYANGIAVDRSLIFDNFSNSATWPLILASGTNNAVGAGQRVDNLADFFSNPPDLGCHDRANGALHWGNREAGEISTKTEHWTKH